MAFLKHQSSIFHISAFPGEGPGLSRDGGNGGSPVGSGSGGADPEDFEVALEEEEPVERRTDGDEEDEVTRVLVLATLIVLERVEVMPVDRLTLLAVLVVEVGFEEEDGPVERRMDDDMPVDRLTLLAVLAVEVGFEEEEPAEKRIDDDREDVVTRVLVADTAVVVELERVVVTPVDRLTVLTVLIVENGFEEKELVERRMDVIEDAVTRLLVADTVVFMVLERLEVIPVDKLIFLAVLIVKVGFPVTLVLRIMIAEDDVVGIPVLDVLERTEVTLVDRLKLLVVLAVEVGFEEALVLPMMVAEDELVESPVLNVMDDLIVEKDAVLELALMDGLDETPVLELTLPDSLDETPVFRETDGVDENPVRKLLGVVRTRVLKLAEGLGEVPELKAGFDEDPVLRDTVGLLETPVLGLTGVAETLMTEDLEEKPVLSDTEDLEEKPVLSDADGLEERPVLSEADGLDEPVLSEADGLEEKLVVSGSKEGLEVGVVKWVETTLALEDFGVTVILGVVSMHEQMVLMNCGSCVKQDAHIDELSALSVGEGAVIVFLSFLPDLSSSRLSRSRSSRSSAVTVTAATGKFREQYASAGG